MKETILILEDHDFLRRSLRVWFEMAFPASQIFEATSEAEALAIAETWAPSIVFLNIGPPYVKGFETVKRLKTTIPEAKITILSMHADDVFQTSARAAGASEIVPVWELVTRFAIDDTRTTIK